MPLTDPENDGGPALEGEAGPVTTTTATQPASFAPSTVLDPASLCEVARMSVGGGTMSLGDLPPFLVERLDQLALARESGAIRSCRHIRLGGLTHFLPWDPTRLRCRGCAALALAGLAGSVEDVRCDCCGHPQERLSLCTIVTGGLAITFGICGLCRLAQVSS